MRVKATGALCLSTFLYGMYGVYSRWIGLDFGPFAQNISRNLIIILILLLILLIKKSWKPVPVKDLTKIIPWVFSGLVSVIAVFIAFNKIPIGTALFLFYAGSILSGYLAGSLIFSEKLTIIKILAIILSLFGVGLIYFNNINFGISIYIFLALLAGSGSGLWNVLSKLVSNKYSGTQLVFLDSIIQTIFSLIFIIFLREKLSIPQFNLPWLSIFAWALTMITCASLVIYGFKQLEAQSASLIMPLEVFFGAFFGFIFFQEVLSPLTLFGGILIIIAFILPYLKSSNVKVLK